MDVSRCSLVRGHHLTGWIWRISLLVSLQLLTCLQAATLIRGPYLQLKTSESIRIRWRTDVQSPSIVFFGIDPAFLYEIRGNLEEVTEHEVEILGLKPSTRYYYSVGGLFEALASGENFHFDTAPPDGLPTPTRIWAIGDSGTYKLSPADHAERVRDAYLNLAGARPTDVWLALGDNAYYAGEDKEYQTQFFNVYPTLLSQAAVWPAIGNHETYSQENDGILPYFNIFSLPTRGEAGGVASGTENYYSFNHGNIHFVCLDSEISLFTGLQPMLNWLQADLAANTNTWLIAFWHSPPYSTGSHHSDFEFSLAGMRRTVVPILESYGVDLVLSGHSHIYERSFFLRGHYGNSTTLTPEMLLDDGNGRPDQDGPYQKATTGPTANQGTVYVVAGSSGWATFSTGTHPAMFLQELETGSMVIDIDGPVLEAKFLRETGAIDDRFTLIKSDTAQPFRITRLQSVNQTIAIHWRSESGISYQIQISDDLDSDSWSNIGAPVLATGNACRSAIEVPVQSSKKFFRIIKN